MTDVYIKDCGIGRTQQKFSRGYSKIDVDDFVALIIEWLESPLASDLK